MRLGTGLGLPVPTFSTLDLRPIFSPSISLQGFCPKPSLTQGGSAPRPERLQRCHKNEGAELASRAPGRLAQGEGKERVRRGTACEERLQNHHRNVPGGLWHRSHFEGKVHCHFGWHLAGAITAILLIRPLAAGLGNAIPACLPALGTRGHPRKLPTCRRAGLPGAAERDPCLPGRDPC